MDKDINGYKLSRQWFNFCFDNPEKVKPHHTAIYFFAIEHCNRLGWKEKFGFPTQMAMEAVGIKNWRTYNSAFTDLVDWGFLNLIEKSKNQYSSCIISLCKKYNSTVGSLDKALQNHLQKQSNSTVVIDKQLNNKQLNNKRAVYAFSDFWDDYGNKVGKSKCETKWKSISDKDKKLIKDFVPIYKNYKPFDDYQMKNPYTFLNSEIWQDDWDEYKQESESINMERFI